jgi:hypothetical protein
MSGTALTHQRELLARLVTLGEEVTDALDHTNVVSTLGEEELNRAIVAIGDRALPAAATAALASVVASIERVIATKDPHRAIDWIGMQPRLVLTLLAATLNPASLPKDVVPQSIGATVAARIPAGISFTDAPRDGRAVVYSGIQADPILRPLAVAIANATPAERLIARAVMNDPEPTTAETAALFAALPSHRGVSDPLVVGAVTIGGKAQASNAQYRGAVVEATTAEMLRRRPVLANDADRLVRRERRFAIDGVSADPHPFDVTVEAGPFPELWDCKWGARGIDASLLAELEDARIRAAGSSARITIGVVAFDTAAIVAARLSIVRAPREKTRFITLETLGRLAAG